MDSEYTIEERLSLDLLAGSLGYANIGELMRENGYTTLDDLAKDHGYATFREYVSDPGYCCRLEKLARKRDCIL